VTKDGKTQAHKDLTNAQFSILIGWEFRIEHWSDLCVSVFFFLLNQVSLFTNVLAKFRLEAS